MALSTVDVQKKLISIIQAKEEVGGRLFVCFDTADFGRGGGGGGGGGSVIRLF